MMERILTFYRLYLPRAKPFLPHAAAVLFFGILGWGSGFFQASRRVDNPNLTENWSIPAWGPYRAGPEKGLFTSLDIWDGAKRPTVAKAQGPQEAWRFIGTVRTGEDYMAVIAIGATGKIQRASAGDVLPNGEKIVAIDNGWLQIEAAGSQREMKLFKSEPLKAEKK